MSFKIPAKRRPKYNITAVLIFPIFFAVHRLTMLIRFAVSFKIRELIIIHDYEIFMTIYL